ncbi:hypothetical protein jhhlp_003632 [Lomentospora prolificans]|uniref:PHD-type domain-containing protein n=1 Tax=Lomentospora prolificans TaxID=41688 RepID=A0A2N3N9A0_9PEZI|nr:hypothetical protein jhhlp_003632 [Lomentospora prolificans]
MDEHEGSIRRKRGRPQPTKNSIDPECVTKKRKLDDSKGPPDTDSTTRGRSRGGRRSFMSAFSEALSYARGEKKAKETQSQENLRDKANRETAIKAATMPAKRARARATVLSEPGKSVYDFPGSDGESTVATPKKARSKAPSSQNGTPTSTKRAKRSSTTVTSMDVDENDDATNGNAYELMELDDTPSKQTTGKKRGPGRPPGSKNKKTLAQLNPAGSSSQSLQAKPRVDDAARTSPLKSILTPSKKENDYTPRRRKNVAFGLDKGHKDVEIFFEDLATKKLKAPAKRAEEEPETPADGQEEEDDEEVCEICLKPESKPPNEIIFCDNCDLGFHQKCHNVPVIPEGDWLCKNCSQEDITKTPQKSASTAVPVVPADAPDIPNLDKHLAGLQRVLLDRCTGQRRLKLTGLDEAYGKVGQLVEQTVSSGEGNSMLLIGGRGLGKTAVGGNGAPRIESRRVLTNSQLIEKVVSNMAEKYTGEFHVVRLNGFIHTDDKLAIKDTWRQLGKEMEVDDDIVHRTSYADTMTSLLALLSHPSEITGEDEGLISQAVIFVIDEFDQFAYHPRQTLLYNLFDIAQARKAPIAVLGCTTRVDIVEMLEKRVKSRFSHRYVFIAPPRSLPAYWEVCRQGLVVDREDAGEEGMDTELEGFDEFMEYWGKRIDRLYKQDSFKMLLTGHFYMTKSVMGFLNSCILPLSTLSSTNLALQIPRAPPVPPLAAPMSKLHLLPTLSDLDLGLLIAAARLDIVAHTDTVNFAMAYDEYTSLMGRQRVQSASAGMLAMGGGVRVWGRGVAVISWERLIDLGLLVPAGIGGGKGRADRGQDVGC